MPIVRDENQAALLETPPGWVEHWKGMPSYDHVAELSPDRVVTVNFRSIEDRQRFAALLAQRIFHNTRSIWYPEAEIGHFADRHYASSAAINPRYPVYIISKGRWEENARLTSRSLEKINVPYRIVIEPQEYAQYASAIDPKKIIVLPFGNLGQGSIPARNFVWEHSIREGAARHWILDDNIDGFFRFQHNLKCPVGDGTIFRIAEDFTDRYDNVAISGFQYFMFVLRKKADTPPFTANTRIYSCILLSNDIPYRWRGRYNEDTDLSLRALKDGWCTILFNAFLALKKTTMTMKGGNMEKLYAGDDGRLKMAESLRLQHPEHVKIVEKWGRAQHEVDYSFFQKHNRLRLREDFAAAADKDDYGMALKMLGGEES
jgi:hypothetical protein